MLIALQHSKGVVSCLLKKEGSGYGLLITIIFIVMILVIWQHIIAKQYCRNQYGFDYIVKIPNIHSRIIEQIPPY